MRQVAIIGVGSTVFGKFPQKALFELGSEAAWAALRDAGITNIEITNIENACVGGATAFRRAWYDIASGLYDIGIAVGAESMTTSPIAGKLITPAKGDLSGDFGMT